MMKIYKLVPVALAWLLYAGCSSTHKTPIAPGDIDIPEAMEHLTEIKTSNLGSKIKFLPLETHDSALVDKFWSASAVGDKIIISNIGAHGNVIGGISALVFDAETGKFERSLGTVGQGPEEFYPGSMRPIKTSDRVYFKAGNGVGWISYTLDGKYGGKVVPHSSSDAGNLLICGDNDTTLCFMENNIADDKRELIFRTYGLSGSLIDSCVVFEGQPVVYDENMFGDYTGFQMHGGGFPKAGGLIQELKKSNGSYIPLRITTDEVANEVHFHETMCDTVFRLTASGAEPVLTFGFGGKRFPFEELNRRLPKDDEMFVTSVIETPYKVAFSISKGWLSDEGHKEYIGVYDRKTGKVVLGDKKEEGITDDLGGLMPFNLMTTTSSGKWIGVLTMEEIEDWLAEHPDAERPASLANSTLEDNPVLVVISD